jgi:hypothetical protein
VVPDETLGGYLEKHARPPAFEGVDGDFYSVDTYITEGDVHEGFGGALLFVRWSADGSQPIGHLETEYLVTGARRAEVSRQLHAMTLFEIKACLDRLIEAAKQQPDW